MNSEDTVHALLYHGIKARTDPDNAEIQNHIRGWKIEILFCFRWTCSNHSVLI